MQDRWLLRFKEVVQREIDEAGGKNADGYRAVATKTGLGYDYIYQIFTGKPTHKPKVPGHDAMTAIERVYGPAPGSAPPTAADAGAALSAGVPGEQTLAQALLTLAHELQNADDLSREQAGVLLKRLASEPERAEEIAVRLSATLSSGQDATVNKPGWSPVTQTPGFLPKK